MGLFIKIRKLYENNETAYYAVYQKDNENIEFHIGINQKKRLITYYLMNDLEHAILTIDISKEDEPIYPLAGISPLAFSRSVIQGIKALKMKSLPDNLDYIA